MKYWMIFFSITNFSLFADKISNADQKLEEAHKHIEKIFEYPCNPSSIYYYAELAQQKIFEAQFILNKKEPTDVLP